MPEEALEKCVPRNPKYWVYKMFSCQNKIGTIEDIESNSNIHVYVDNNIWIYHPSQIEVLVDKKVDSKQYNCICKICGSPAYLGFMSFECSKCK